MTIDQLMRRIAVQLRGIVEKLDHPHYNDARGAAVMAKSTLDDLHEAAAKLRALELAGQVLSAAADAADADIGQHLQVANYNLHGLLNTGDRIDPPNPPQTIHQAGIDASVAVRHQVRLARQAWRQAREAKP